MIVAIYGINRLGKTTQAELLVDWLTNYRGEQAEYIKFPAYALKPTGPLINNYLRELNGVKNPHNFSPREFQMLNVQNRLDFWKQFRGKPETRHFVLEDYTGTGIAWGMGAGVGKDLLVSLNQNLTPPDFAFLLDGEPFLSGTEEGHTHEEDDELTKRVREAHLELAREFGWFVISANRPEERVHQDICVQIVMCMNNS